MRNLKFKSARAENFLCFGEKGISINFESYGNIVCIKGKNLDVNNEDGSIASNGSGKCFGVNTPILMYDGTIKMVQDVKVGDFVMGHDSTPRTVVELHSGKDKMYKIIPTKGDPFVVNESHILVLKSSDKKYNRLHTNGNHINLSLKDYLDTNKSFKHLMRQFRSSVNFNYNKNLRIDPYFLGVWLGDGSKDKSNITNIDKSIIKRIYKEAKFRNLKVSVFNKKTTKCKTYAISADSSIPNKDAILAYKLKVLEGNSNENTIKIIKNKIKYYENKNLRLSTVWRWVDRVKKWLKLGNKLPKINDYNIDLKDLSNMNYRNSLLNDLKFYNLINNKHIPHDYKCASEEVRLQILAGLFDTDASRQGNCGYEITSKFKSLAEDIVFVARSLGFAAYIKESFKSAQTGIKKKYYRITISGECKRIPVKIKYKKCKKRKINKDPLVFGFKVEPLDKGEYYGFTLKENPLFLLGDFTVVHNSSIPEIITYALYGKTIKKPKKLAHAHIINNKSGHPLMVELLWDDYRLVRTRTIDNKGTLRLWKSDKCEWNKKTEITASGIPATQKEIEKIIGLTYESFINIFIFSDDNTLPFLECDGPTKREIVENLLSLEKYRHYSQNAKDLLKGIKDKIKDLTKEYEYLNSQKESATIHISQIEKQEQDWHAARKRELDFLLLEIKQKRDELEKSNAGEALAAYQEAQEQIVTLKATLPTLENNKNNYNDYAATITAKLSKQDENIDKYNRDLKATKTEYQRLERIVSENRKIIDDVENKSGKSCPYCLNIVDKNQFAEICNKANEILNNNQAAFDSSKIAYENAENAYNNAITVKRNLEKGLLEVRNRLSKLNSEISGIHCEIVDLSKIEKPNADVAELLICEQIESLKKQANDKQDQLKGLTPFEDIKKSAFADLAQRLKECNDKKEEIKKSENELPYYEFWVKAFGDSGIRKYIIDGIIPTLNDRVEYWLQYLIDNKIKLTFDNELDETIDRYPFNGRPYVYHGMSGGQRRRLNLTVAAAWAFISALNSGASPSVIFLDEVTMNMDVVGVQGIFRMICELAKEKQVFVIDHNENLLQMLDGCDTINLEMQDEISNKVDILVNN